MNSGRIVLQAERDPELILGLLLAVSVEAGMFGKQMLYSLSAGLSLRWAARARSVAVEAA